MVSSAAVSCGAGGARRTRAWRAGIAALVAAVGLAAGPGPAGAQPEGWVTLASMPAARQEIAVAVLAGEIVVLGGFDAQGASTDTVQAYSPRTDTWRLLAPLPAVNNHGAAATAGGRLFAFGGTSPRTFVYDPSGNRWLEVASMHFAHGGTPAVAVIQDRIYVAGGTGPGMVGNEVEVYDPATNVWTLLAPMGVPRNHTAGGVIGGRFYVVGGRGHPQAAGAFEVYDPGANSWAPLPPLPAGRSGLGAAAVGGRLYVFGGELPQLFANVDVFDPATQAWQPLDPMPLPRHGIVAGVTRGQIYLPGGGVVQGLGPTNAHTVFRVRLPRGTGPAQPARP
jgi:N-acetylneuraminic acid mutarotase